MCGIAGIFGTGWERRSLEAMVAAQRHRGPDAEGIYVDPSGTAGLGHNRLSIIDLSDQGRQPMVDPEGRYHIVFNGEIYNYLELREQLRSVYNFRTGTDTEVLLAAYRHWGGACLDRLIGMFTFAVWDAAERQLFAARDRFGVKPFNYHLRHDGTLFLASEIKALRAGGVAMRPDSVTWATYLANGLYDHCERTFWDGVRTVPPGHAMTWRDGRLGLEKWYDLAERTAVDVDLRPQEEVEAEYYSLLEETIRLRFRSDVPVGINLSGGLDSSVLLGMVQAVQGRDSNVKAFTFATGDPRYDELPWVEEMLTRTRHPSVVCQLESEQVPDLAASVQWHQDEPFGGLPTLAYAHLFARARDAGVIVLLDGQGMDEQWAGYDYYADAVTAAAPTVQGTCERPVRPECLTPEFRRLARTLELPAAGSNPVRRLQLRDTRYTKIPRALRFNDRISMRASTELREPFLDHRLFELAIRQPIDRKIQGGTQKWLLREVAARMLPGGVVEAPKRPLQTPQREWLRGPLQAWAADCIDTGLRGYASDWLDAASVWRTWEAYQRGESDNSFYVWQWISLGLMNVLSEESCFAAAAPFLARGVRRRIV